jgi:hypothetical protein
MVKRNVAGSNEMNLNRGRLAPVVLVAWLVIVYGSLVFLGIYTIELYFTISLVGFLTVGLLFAPPQTSRRWWSMFRLLTIPALLVFGYVVFQRVMAVV